MKLTIKTPSLEFKQALDKFLARSTLAFKDEINARLLDIAIKAYQGTKTADRAKVLARLGAATKKETVFVSKFGSTRRSRVLGFDDQVTKSLAYAIVQKRARERFGRFLPVSSAVEKARKLLAGVSRSIGFIRSGWIPAMRRLNSVVKGGQRAMFTNEQRGQPKGYARPATSTETLTGEIANTTKVAADIAGPALENAIAKSAAFMEGVMQREQEKIAAEMAKTIG